MQTFAPYNVSLWGILLIIITAVVQAFIAMNVKASQPGAIPGKIDPNLSHSSFVFRTHRTFMNTLENTPIMLATCFLAMFSGANVFWTGLLVWIYAMARILHMVLYYAIATEKNPSPRSYAFMAGFIANIVLLGFCESALV
jgi:uncharacterized MAPEG superfamily protein